MHHCAAPASTTDLVSGACAADESFGRHAAHVEAVAAEEVLLYDRHTCTNTCGPCSADEAPGASADDHQIISAAQEPSIIVERRTAG